MFDWLTKHFKDTDDPMEFWFSDKPISYSALTFEQKCELFVNMFASLDPTSKQALEELKTFLGRHGVLISSESEWATFQLESYMAFKSKKEEL
jgi:hypothetical protein